MRLAALFLIALLALACGNPATTDPLPLVIDESTDAGASPSHDAAPLAQRPGMKDAASAVVAPDAADSSSTPNVEDAASVATLEAASPDASAEAASPVSCSTRIPFATACGHAMPTYDGASGPGMAWDGCGSYYQCDFQCGRSFVPSNPDDPVPCGLDGGSRWEYAGACGPPYSQGAGADRPCVELGQSDTYCCPVPANGKAFDQ